MKAELQWRREAGVERGEFMNKVAELIGVGASEDVMMAASTDDERHGSSPAGGSAGVSGMVGTLDRLIQWHQAGVLSENEFAKAKAMIGL